MLDCIFSSSHRPQEGEAVVEFAAVSEIEGAISGVVDGATEAHFAHRPRMQTLGSTCWGLGEVESTTALRGHWLSVVVVPVMML